MYLFRIHWGMIQVLSEKLEIWISWVFFSLSTFHMYKLIIILSRRFNTRELFHFWFVFFSCDICWNRLYNDCLCNAPLLLNWPNSRFYYNGLPTSEVHNNILLKWDKTREQSEVCTRNLIHCKYRCNIEFSRRCFSNYIVLCAAIEKNRRRVAFK